MTKKPANRPSTAEILKMPYVRERMRNFVESTETNLLEVGAPVFKKQRPTIKRLATREMAAPENNAAGANFHPGQNMNVTNTSVPNVTVDLTPKQRMEKRRQEEIARRQEELKQAAHGAKQNYTQANAQRQKNTFESIMGAPNQTDFDPSSVERFYIPAGNANNTNTAFPHDRLGAAA